MLPSDTKVVLDATVLVPLRFPCQHVDRSVDRSMDAVPNIAWQSYLQLSLHFEPYMLGVMAAAGSIMTCIGVTAYKTYFFNVSWR